MWQAYPCLLYTSREQAFLAQNRDCFAIYQVSRDDPQNVRFMNLDWLKSHDISIDRSNYDLIYTAPLRESGTVPEQLEKLYEQFNLQRPADFHSPSMSVSDIVAIKPVSYTHLRGEDPVRCGGTVLCLPVRLYVQRSCGNGHLCRAALHDVLPHAGRMV